MHIWDTLNLVAFADSSTDKDVKKIKYSYAEFLNVTGSPLCDGSKFSWLCAKFYICK